MYSIIFVKEKGEARFEKMRERRKKKRLDPFLVSSSFGFFVCNDLIEDEVTEESTVNNNIHSMSITHYQIYRISTKNHSRRIFCTILDEIGGNFGSQLG